MTTAIQAAMQQLRAEIEQRTAALAALERIAAPYGTMIEVAALPAPARAERAKRETSPPPPSGLDLPAKRRAGSKIDPDAVRRLHGEGLTDGLIAERIGGVTAGAVRLHRVKLGLAALGKTPIAKAPATGAPAEALRVREIVRWLREVNVAVAVIEPGKRWQVNGQTYVNAVELLAMANTRRARMGQPLFELAT